MVKQLYLFILILGSISLCYGENDTKRDSLNSIYEKGLRSLIDTVVPVATTPVDKQQFFHNPDSVKTEEEGFLLRTYGVFNTFMLTTQFVKPFTYKAWKIERTKSLFDPPAPSFGISLSKDVELENYFAIDSIRQLIHHNIIFKNPYLVKSVYKELPPEYVVKDIVPEKKHIGLLSDIINTEIISRENLKEQPLEIRVNQRGHWFFQNRSLVHFTQKYISSNWYQGGESNLAVYALLNMKANYIHHKGWTLYNELEWRASFYTAQTDTVHTWRSNDELFRISSLLAIKASEKWNYTVSYEFKTRFFNAFKPNSRSKVAAPFSPLESSLGLGMSLTSDFPKVHISEFKMIMSPFSYNYKYVDDSKYVDVTSFGIEKGKKELSQVGSRLDLQFTYKMPQNISLKTRLYYFTTYHSVESEWENNLSMNINTYFSVNLFIHMRFDDKRVLAKDQNSYFQFREIFSLGWSYNW